MQWVKRIHPNGGSLAEFQGKLFGVPQMKQEELFSGLLSVARSVMSMLVILGGLSGVAYAQLDQLTPEQLQALQARGLGSQLPSNSNASEKLQAPITLTPAAPGSREPYGSLLETALSQRAGQKLEQFGYDQIGIAKSVVVPQVGAVQDDYVLAPGDEIRVTLRGQENSNFSAVVDRNGQVVLPKISPVTAAGRTFGAFKNDLTAAITRAFISTKAYISLGQLSQVTVFVTGEVANPGTRILTGLSSPLDALLISGGVKKSGSLRSIQLIRHGHTYDIDLYGVLTKRGSQKLMNLRDGDRIFVPPIGKTVAVSGYVRRPAIYELPSGTQSIRAGDLIALASGVVLRGASTASVLRIMPDGKGRFFDISGQPEVPVQDGEIVIVKSAVDIAVGKVTLTGAVRTPGVFSVDKFQTLHQILPSQDALQSGAYILFGFIDRINQQTLQHEALPFSPMRVLSGKEDVTLRSDDTVYVLSYDDVSSILKGGQELKKDDANQKESNDATRLLRQNNMSAHQDSGASFAGSTGGAVSGREAIAEAVRKNIDGSEERATALGGAMGAARGAVSGEAAAITASGQISEAVAGIGSVNSYYGKKLSDYRFTIAGAVQRPGTYLVAPNTSLADTLAVLGGLTSDVDLSSFELTSIVVDNTSGLSHTERKRLPATDDQLASLALQPYDVVLFRPVFSDRDQGTVAIEGEVRYPGSYAILRTERLSSVLKRAGGLTDVAFPYGTVFLRQQVADRQRANNQRLASDIRSQLFAVMMRPAPSGQQPPSAQTIIALQDLVSQIENQPALGRVSYIADPDYLSKYPEKDPVLQPGDRIVIPKRPSSVTVLGEVMQPGAFPVDESMSAFDYIEAAGGVTEFADSSRVIIVYPDGTAKVAGSNWLSFGSGSIPPGATVVVARDVTGISLHQWVLDATQIISQLAVSAASIAVISTNLK